MRKPALVIAVSFFLLSVFACSCATVPTGATSILPTFAPAYEPTITRPPLTIQYCGDVTTSYPPADFQAANHLIASSLTQAVFANQQGVTLYVTAITHNTFDPSNTLSPPFTIPSISGYPPQPTAVPTYPPENPVFDGETATAVHNQTVQAIISYNQAVAQINGQVRTAQATARADAQRLDAWNPPQDNIATSVLGCFELAASRFAGQSGDKLLYVASDLENNTDVDYTTELVTQHRLLGVIVHVIDFYSANAQRDQQKRDLWCPYLKSAGASVVTFDLPSQALSDLFDTDIRPHASYC